MIFTQALQHARKELRSKLKEREIATKTVHRLNAEIPKLENIIRSHEGQSVNPAPLNILRPQAPNKVVTLDTPINAHEVPDGAGFITALGEQSTPPTQADIDTVVESHPLLGGDGWK